VLPHSLTSALTGRPGPAARGAMRQRGLTAPPAFPRGWYAVGFSTKLRPGRLQALTFMGTDAVLYRTASGQVRLAEAYCPHLGAHLGLGGVVRGEVIQCPFHGLGFGADGHCVSSPDGRPPRTARLRMFETCEVDGVIVAYHDPDGLPAQWRIESRAPGGRWPAATTRTWRFRGHPQEVSENSVDLAHLSELHQFRQVRVIEPVTTDGPRLAARYAIRRRLLFNLGVSSEFSVRVEGLGFSVVELSIPSLSWEVYQLVLPTSVDETDVALRLSVSLRRAEGARGWRRLLGVRPVTALAQRFVASVVVAEINRDIPIWQHKRYLERPALCPGEGSIGRYRKWTRQFYPPSGPVPTPAPEPVQLEGRQATDATAC
jgi:nitrite reductase/ring-hydroxylating ferredoxin subunit